MEETVNKDDAMRKNIIQNTEEKRVQKSKTPFRLQKNDHRKFWICLGKRTDTEMKKKKKEENKNEIKNKRERSKMSYNKKRIRKNGDGEKNRYGNMRNRKKKEWRKEDGHKYWALFCSRSCALQWWRAAVTIFQFACFFFQVIELLFPHFFARSSLDLRHRPLNPLGSVSLPWVSQSYR